MKLQRDLPVLKKAGFGVGAISYDSAAVLHAFATRKNITFPLLADHDSTVIREYGVADRRYRKGNQLDIDTETVHSSSTGFVPIDGLAYPSIFVLGPDRQILWRYVSESSEFRYSAAEILEGSTGFAVRATSASVSARHIHISETSSDAEAGFGTRMLLGVEVGLPAGVHVYAPGAPQQYHGLSWQMNDSKNCWQAASTVYPKPASKTLPFDPERVEVYENKVRMTREVAISPAINPKAPSLYKNFRALCLDGQEQVHISGTLEVQACDDHECFPPQEVPLEWRIHFDAPDFERAPVDLRREFEQ